MPKVLKVRGSSPRPGARQASPLETPGKIPRVGAVLYHAGGRKLSAADMKAMYTPMLNEAKQLHATYAGEIQQRAGSLDTTAILNLVRGKAAV